MAERAEKLGATLDILSRPGHGTSVVLTLPVSEDHLTDSAAPAASAIAVH
jgi:two-component system, NarL family, nitrate/nitrite sensor histidine kinase NarX